MNTLITGTERKSYIAIGQIYFWTATINNWQHLMAKDEYKEIVIGSLRHLSEKGKIDVFAFVVMPNHIHLIWRTNELNGKETVQGSFLKFTAHAFKKALRAASPAGLAKYAVATSNKEYEFWQRDSLAVPLYTRAVAFQKLTYIHNNPVAPHWQLAADFIEYSYSSAKYYECNEKNFDFLKDLTAEF
jgi:putative transposase